MGMMINENKMNICHLYPRLALMRDASPSQHNTTQHHTTQTSSPTSPSPKHDNSLLPRLRPPNNPNLIRRIARHEQPSLGVKSQVYGAEAACRAGAVAGIAHHVDGGGGRGRRLSRHAGCGVEGDLAEAVAVGWLAVPGGLLGGGAVWEEYRRSGS